MSAAHPIAALLASLAVQAAVPLADRLDLSRWLALFDMRGAFNVEGRAPFFDGSDAPAPSTKTAA